MRADVSRLRVLFLCTGNSCRSQMAEGWARHLPASRVEAFSAGTEPKMLDPLAVKVMAEVGVKISGQRSKHLSEVQRFGFDCAVTVCGQANESCPVFPGNTRVVHHGFEDPPRLAAGSKTEEEALKHYRCVRDEIRRCIERLPVELAKEHCDIPSRGGADMKIQVFDPPMCCPTGICGPSINPELVRFAADLDWLKHQGLEVERYNLSQQPEAFATNPVVKGALVTEGNSCLPLTLADGRIVCSGRYPSREALIGFAGLESRAGAPAAKVSPCCCGSLSDEMECSEEKPSKGSSCC